MKIKLSLSFLFLFTVFGLHSLMVYSGKEGVMARSQNSWPQPSKLKAPSKNHLVMFIHPGCSCSKASISELSRLMASAPELTAQVVVMKSPKLDPLFPSNPLIEAAKSIPRTEIFFDQDGEEANLFSAQTSGLTHLYNSERKLVFSGGITIARGHEGDSEGKNAILTYLKGEASRSKALVFGCDIFGELRTFTMVK